jgi:aminopeptidase
MDNKLNKLSQLIVNYSLKLQKDERVLINAMSVKTSPLVIDLIESITEVGALPFVRIYDNEITNKLIRNTTDSRIKEIVTQKEDDNKNYDAFINVRYTENEYEGKTIPASIKSKINKATSKADKVRINERKWVLLNYPSIVDAYKAKMSFEDFSNYALEAMTYDYSQFEEMVEPLKQLMEKTDKVRILGPNTDITFSIKNMPIRPCLGQSNIPDGEIYTAPLKESVNGVISYNVPSTYSDNVFNNVRLTFENGKIIDMTSDNDIEQLKEIFNTDDGSKYIGEFSIGFNPLITKPVGDILYDEKIYGSIHFTPGQCYSDADNGNDSAIHWDLVLIQTEEFGGGEIFFDDVLIRKDGKFVLSQLNKLN